MKFQEVLNRIENLDKSDILIKDYISKDYSKISLTYKNKRILDLRQPQFEKLKKLGYNYQKITV